VKIDSLSGWAEHYELKLCTEPGGPIPDWKGRVTINDHFLAHELEVIDPKFNPQETSSVHAAFWQGYLEGTFSTALMTWFGLRTDVKWLEDVPLLTAEVHRCGHENQGGTSVEFDVHVGIPRYSATSDSLQRNVLRPYVKGEFAAVVTNCRKVIEGFVRELAGEEPAPTENMREALKFLGKKLPNDMKAAAGNLSASRDRFHPPTHADVRLSRSCIRGKVCDVVATVLQACHDIRLVEAQQCELKEALGKPPVSSSQPEDRAERGADKLLGGTALP
jgi:hypothetical protein